MKETETSLVLLNLEYFITRILSSGKIKMPQNAEIIV